MKKLTLATLFAMSSAAYAGINATPLWVTLQPGSGGTNGNTANIANIVVNNPDSNVAYVKTTILKVEKIGDPNSPTVEFQPGDNPQQFGLLVSPTKFAIKPNNSITVRVSNLNPNPTQDAQYTILFTPVSNPNASSSDTSTSTNNSSSKVNLNMHVVVSYQTSVFVVPKNITMKVCTKTTGNNVTVNNQGNTFIQMTNGQLCNTQGQNCNPFASYDYKLIPAGNSFTLQIPQAGVVTYTVNYGNGQSMQLNSKTSAC